MLRRMLVALLALGLALGPTGAGTALAVGTAVADTYPSDGLPILEDVAFSVAAPGVLSNDTREPGFGIDMCLVDYSTTSGQGGAVSAGQDGSFTYTPPADFNGADTFSYSMADFTDSCPAIYESSTQVTLNVTAVNDAPHVVTAFVCADAATQAAAEDSGAYSGANDCVRMDSFGPSNESGQSLVEWTITAANPALFSVQPSLELRDATYGKLHFTPAPNANGSTTLTIRGRDDGGTANSGVDLSNAVTVPVTITPVNDAPTAATDSFQALKDSTLNIAAPGVLANDGDVDGDPITAVLVNTTTHGVLTLAANGSFSYTPQAGYVGPDAFSYKAGDATSFSPPRVVSITVSAVPVPTPTAAVSAAPSAEPSAEPSVEASPEASASTVPTLEPSASAPASGAPSSGATPGATEPPGPVSDGGGISLPVLLVLVLLAALLAFGAAFYLPRLLGRAGPGGPDEDEPDDGYGPR